MNTWAMKEPLVTGGVLTNVASCLSNGMNEQKEGQSTDKTIEALE